MFLKLFYNSSLDGKSEFTLPESHEMQCLNLECQRFAWESQRLNYKIMKTQRFKPINPITQRFNQFKIVYNGLYLFKIHI